MYNVGLPSTVIANRLRFSLVHAARSLGWASVDLMLAWHFHIVVGFPGLAVAYLLCGCLLVGSSTSFAVGWLLSKYQVSGQSCIRIQLIGSLAAGALLAAQFLIVSPAWSAVIAIAFRVAYSLQDVPQNALASMLPWDGDDSKVYARLHMTLSSAARLIIVGAHLLFLENHIADRQLVILVVAAAMGGSAFGLWGARFPIPLRSESRKTEQNPALSSSLVVLLAGFACAGALLPTLSRLLIFSPDVADQTGLGSWMLAVFYIGSVAGPTAHARLSAVVGERQAGTLWILIGLAGGAVMILPLAPVLREGAAAVHGLALNAIGVRLWSRAAQIARTESDSGLVFGAVIPTLHISSAVGALLMGPLIEPYEGGSTFAAASALSLTALGSILIRLLDVRRRRGLAWA